MVRLFREIVGIIYHIDDSDVSFEFVEKTIRSFTKLLPYMSRKVGFSPRKGTQKEMRDLGNVLYVFKNTPLGKKALVNEGDDVVLCVQQAFDARAAADLMYLIANENSLHEQFQTTSSSNGSQGKGCFSFFF